MSGIFNPQIFSAAIFNIGGFVPPTPPAEVIKTGTGGIDGQDVKRRSIVKPLGTLHLPKKKRPVDARVDDSREIQAEIAARLAREFTEENAALHNEISVAHMSMAEVEREIGALLRKKVRTADDEATLFLLMIAAAL